MLRKILIIFLVSAIFLSLLPACKDTETQALVPGTPKEGPNEAKDESEPEFPEADFGGADFTIFSRDREAAVYRPRYIYSEGLDGEMLNDEAYMRNMAVEEKYNVRIKLIEHMEPHTVLKREIMAGGNDIELILDQGNALFSLMGDGVYYNLYNLNHVNIDRPYWDPNSIKGYEIADKSFLFNNDVSIAYFTAVRFIYFNSKMVRDYGLEDPYQLIDKNEWTIDKFIELTKSVSTDLGGAGTSAVNEYVFGMFTENGLGNGTHVHLGTGCGIKLAQKEADGSIIPALKNEKTVAFLDKCRDILLNPLYARDQIEISAGADMSGFNNAWDYGRSLFSSGHFLFTQSSSAVAVQFESMDEFGIAPNPKWDSKQEEYAHKTDLYGLAFAIPVNVKNPDKLGMILDYWAYVSSKTVFPAYYEIFLKIRKMRDENALSVLDIVKRTIVYDIGEILSASLQTAYYNGYHNGNFVSEYEKYEPKITQELNKLYEYLSNLD